MFPGIAGQAGAQQSSSPPSASGQVYHIAYTPLGRMQATYTMYVETPQLQATQWLICLPKPPSLPGQVNASCSGNPELTEFQELSDLRRPMLMTHFAGTGMAPSHIDFQAVYQATMYQRQLLPGKPAKTVLGLTDGQRRAALGTNELIDYKSDGFVKWLRGTDLRRQAQETEIEFARRVFQYITTRITPVNTPSKPDEEEWKASRACLSSKADAGTMCNLFAAILRTADIPTRTLVGQVFKIETVSLPAPVKRLGYGVRAEFYAQDVGWVPVDLADKRFGEEATGMLVQHIDNNLRIDSGALGIRSLHYMQRAHFWALGKGSFGNMTVQETWKIQMLPVSGGQSR